jgi:uncharacterized protein (TIGR02301 family)
MIPFTASVVRAGPFNPASRTASRTLMLAILLALGMAGSAFAQERSPTERQSLVDLAYAMGESHALRQVCNGETDQFWRDRMMQLSEAEIPDAALDSRLKQSFNSGFAARHTQFTECGIESRKLELSVARKGQAIAGRLAKAVRPVQRMGPDDPSLQPPDQESVEPKGPAR